jgi:hypothetical protein
MKSGPLPSPKSSMKPSPKVTRGFVSANSPCWLRNSKRKLVRCWLRNHHIKTFQSWCVDSEILADPVDSEKINANLVAADSEIITQTSSKGDAWIRKRSHPLLTWISSTNMESVMTQNSSMKHLPQVTPRIVSAPNPCWLTNSQRNLSRCRLRNHHLNTFQRWCVDSKVLAALVNSEKLNQNEVGAKWKSSTRQLPKVTRGFVSVPNPCWHTKSQWKLSHYCLQNH